METIKLDKVKGVGAQTLKNFRDAGIWSTYDLILRTPKTYHDYTIKTLANAPHKEKVTVMGMIIDDPVLQKTSKIEIVKFKADVNYHEVKVIIFGRGYLASQYKKGNEVIIHGTYDLYKNEINVETISKQLNKDPLKPIYGIDGIYDTQVTEIVKTIYNEDLVDVFDIIPLDLINKRALLKRKEAYKLLHLPQNMNQVNKANRTLKYEEAFLMQLKLSANQQTKVERPPKMYHLEQVKRFINSLPFELTDEQKAATNDIFRDFKGKYASFRLLQGEVGSGKTIVSAIAMLAVVSAGEQVCYLAPTELLATQTYNSLKKYFKGLNIALLTSSTKDKKEIKDDIKLHMYDIIVGTHALFESDVEFASLGFIVIDEQHKFGVEMRKKIIDKATYKDVLYLTATPIPRTMSLILFGGASISTIKEKPFQNTPVSTIYITKSEIDKFYDEVDAAINRNEHIYVVVPAISSNHVSDNIETVSKELLKRFKTKIFILHGQLKESEKMEIMREFSDSPGTILLATTMIEVGIDIATATLIGIYAAENFGLSQIHQLRGRVGRSGLSSSCYLISEKPDIERLEIATKTNDGFKLSEYDLLARGPGDFLGSDQSGFIEFKFLDIANDYQLLYDARKDVNELLNDEFFKRSSKFKYLMGHINEKENLSDTM